MSEINSKNTIRMWFLSVITGVLVIMANHPALASNVEKYIDENCVTCHAITKPDYKTLGISERMQRKGPLLYYAGDKFNKDWLQHWLESPSRIRPGGSFPPDHTVVTDDGDVIDKKTLPVHMSVPKEMAVELAKYLMSFHLDDKPELETPYTPGSVSMTMGKMNFNKFKGCSACHRDNENVGGVSGPEMYTAWKRMQPEFIISYIKNPVAWDPHTMMPNRHLQEKDIHKLVDYLKLIGDK